jgi:hypothetical protein
MNNKKEKTKPQYELKELQFSQNTELIWIMFKKLQKKYKNKTFHYE